MVSADVSLGGGGKEENGDRGLNGVVSLKRSRFNKRTKYKTPRFSRRRN